MKLNHECVFLCPPLVNIECHCCRVMTAILLLGNIEFVEADGLGKNIN
jgi:hypothetical protein